MWRDYFLVEKKCIFSSHVHCRPGLRNSFCYVNDGKHTERLVILMLHPSGAIVGGEPIVMELSAGKAMMIDAGEALLKHGITSFDGSFLVLVSNIDPTAPFDVTTKDHVSSWMSESSGVEIVTAGHLNINVPGKLEKKSFFMFCSNILITADTTTRVTLFNHSTEGEYMDTAVVVPKLHNLKGETIEGKPVTMPPFGSAVIDIHEWFGQAGEELLAKTGGRGTLSAAHLGHTIGSLFFHMDRATGAFKNGQHTQPVIPAVFRQPGYNYWVEWVGAHMPLAGHVIPLVSWLRHHRDALATFYPHHSNYVPSLWAYIKQSRFSVWGKMMLRALYFLVKRRFRIDEMNFSGVNEHNEYVIQHNLWNNLKLFQFSRGRVEALLYPLMSVPGMKKDGKTLCIGPKNEGEMLLMEAHGFRDVIGIDLFTYSPKIFLMDMHEMRFSDNTFDTIMSGAVIRYSYDAKKAVREMIRVAKDGAMLIVSFGLFPPEDELDFCQSPLSGGIKELLSLFGEAVDHVYWWNEGQLPGKKSKICSVIFRLKKTPKEASMEAAPLR